MATTPPASATQEEARRAVALTAGVARAAEGDPLSVMEPFYSTRFRAVKADALRTGASCDGPAAWYNGAQRVAQIAEDASEMPIRVLPPDLAAKIAAGEVIERPVSVAKELLENAIDAGADEIRLEIAQGGRRLIRVSDDGCGIPATEVELAFCRHATSKLSSAEELYQVRTLGFRGEALASIAAVSRVTLFTRADGDQVGTLVRLEGGQVTAREARGRPPGTMVQVENLFYNTPARLKFLRTDATEAGHVARLATSYALAYPGVRILLQHNSRLVLRTTGTGELLDALVAVHGLDVAEQMLALEPARAREARVRVSGYVGLPQLHRASRQDLVFFVNRRWVQDNSLSYAVTQAYRSLLPAGRYPMAVISVDLPREDVDVNIHPTKREVRFRRQRDVFAAVQKAVRETLMAQRPVSVIAPSAAPTRWQATGLLGDLGTADAEQGRIPLVAGRGGALGPLAPSPGGERLPTQRLPMLRVLGQIAQTYIVAEGPGGIYLIDQHAAHERIRYEELQAQRAAEGLVGQALLEPLPIDLSPQRAAILEGHLDALKAYGLEVVPFGGTTFLIKRVPASLVGRDAAAALGEMVDAALDGGETFSWEEQALVTLSCHTAIRAGQTLSLQEMRDLVGQLERAALPHTCPHGRPTMIHLSQAQLEREFGRR